MIKVNILPLENFDIPIFSISQIIKMEKYQSEQVQSDVTISGVLELQAEQLPSCIFSKYKSGDSSPTLPFRLWNQDEEMNQSFGDASNSEKQMTRGPYKKYTEEEKLAAV